MKYLYTFVFIFITFFSFDTFSSVIIQDHPGIIKEEIFLSVNKIYPNPVKDKLNVDLFSKESGVLFIYVYDILGNELIKRKAFLNYSGKSKININLSKLHSGIYIVKLVKEEHSASVRVRKQ